MEDSTEHHQSTAEDSEEVGPMGRPSVACSEEILADLQAIPPATRSPIRAALGKQLSAVFDSAATLVGNGTAAGTAAAKSAPHIEPVQVYLRLRPIPGDQESAIEVRPDGKSVRATAPAPLNERKEYREPRDYSFTRVMDDTTSQEAMYEAAAADIVGQFSDQGKSGLLFTYGVTNAGKSHTVLGSKEEPGLLPRSLESICAGCNFDDEARGGGLESEEPGG